MARGGGRGSTHWQTEDLSEDVGAELEIGVVEGEEEDFCDCFEVEGVVSVVVGKTSDGW